MGGTELITRAGAVRALAERWLRLLSDGDGDGDGGGGGGAEDFVCSPAGLWLALGAVASGARDGAAEELRAVLGVAGAEAADAVTAVGRELAGTDALDMATGVWSGIPLLPSWTRALPDVGSGPLGRDAQARLDAWVREATACRIDRLPLSLDGSEALVLVNALALKASWQARFAPALTRDEPFTDAAGATVAVPTMHQRLPARWVWTVSATGVGAAGVGAVTVVELPCEGERGALVRFVLGPKGAGSGAGVGAAEVLAAAWAPPTRREHLAAEAVDLALPRFSLRTKTDVHARLGALGVGLATRPEADFTGLSAERPLWISAAAQEALVEVAEEGVEAAAVTAVAMTRGAAPPRHRVVERIAFDRPFGVVVLDASGEVPLLVGWRSSAPGHSTGPAYSTTRASSSPS
ncbi:serine protease [Streptomyces sp. QHH-9511]|uniref:serpin family protein n=1 Tax=Streptomyces sp. QHH-9511 TaxID=2684468 RepID=UPI001318A56A|nr:serpin family protein [Streptomyces sp. QHH-9511]QGZ48731.1 serine protease [Streptomyces sp. QHH-9511]